MTVMLHFVQFVVFLPLLSADVAPDCQGQECSIHINSLIQSKHTAEMHIQSKQAPDGYAAPEGFSGPLAGYCKLENGKSPYGLGVVERATAEACGAYCKEIQAPRTCRGFNYAPGVHNQCHVFGEHPHHGSGSWGWQCYQRNLVDPSDVPPMEEGKTCTDSDNGALDKELNDCVHYNTFDTMCGQLDDDDFTASSMCCACGRSALTDDEQGKKACKKWCYNKKHVDRPWFGNRNVKNNKCDWVNCALCPECDGHAERVRR